MKEKMLELVENNEKLVCVKHLCATSLNIALNPEFSLDHAYYTITKGENHIFTVVKKDGTTQSFSFGKSGYTLISDNTLALKKRVIEFLEDNGVFLRMEGKPQKISIWRASQYDEHYTCRIDGERNTCELIHLPFYIANTPSKALEFLKDRYKLPNDIEVSI